MGQIQEIREIGASELVARVRQKKDEGWRLSQIGATRCESDLEVNYSFDKDLAYATLRVRLPLTGGAVPSVSGVYMPAFLYENEVHDLFGVEVTGMAVDYKGKFYRKSEATPFNMPSPPKEGGA